MPKIKKILLSIPALQGGGAERVLTTLANAWINKGYQVCMVTYEGPQVKPHYAMNSKIDLVSLDCLNPCKYAKPLDLIKRLLGLRKQIKKFKPDVVLSFLDTNNIMAVIATTGLNVPTFVSERTNPKTAPIGFLKARFRNWAYNKASMLIVQNDGIKNCFSKTIQGHTCIIPNPVIVPTNIEWKGGNNEFVAVGRIDPQKGYKYFIEAFAKISEKHPDWTLKIIGDKKNTWASLLEAQVQKHGIENRVFMEGSIKNPQQEIIKSNIYVLPSLYEGMPNALMEAMAVGMPVISTDCEFGPSDLIDDNKDGILVSTHDAESLANAMDRLASDPKLQKKLGHAAREKMKNYDLKHILDLWQKAFESKINHE